MKIVSKFSDYYDSVMKQGVDLNKVFIRETKELDKATLPKDWQEKRENSYRHKFAEYQELELGYHNHPRLGWIKSIYIVFAGKLYGGFETINACKSGIKYVWNEEDLTTECQQINLDLDRKSWYSKQTDLDIARQIFSVNGSEVLSSWAINNSISIAKISFDLQNRGYRIITENPCLKDMNFQKVIDPFTAYQELDMWIGGVIGQNPQPDEVSDSVKIQQHGFDKWSFRKHKLDNTKARKK